jgi:pimeloyl-ACP methyl ester carboxylesterase
MVLVTSDGVELATRAWSPRQPPRASVVLVHGFTATKDDGNVVALAAALCDRGIDVVAYDARGHGQSGGACTLGDLERHDVAAAVRWARRLHPAVVVVGASMGGIAVLRHAVLDPDLSGVVTVSTPAEWRIPRRPRALLTVGLTRTAPGRWVSARRMRVRLDPVWRAAEPPRALAARVPSPLAVVHGGRDRLIPANVALELFSGATGTSGPPQDAEGPDVARSEAAGPRRLFLVPRMGHAFDPLGHGAICDAVDWALTMAGGR